MFNRFNNYLQAENERQRERITQLESRQQELVDLIVFLRKPERMTVKQEVAATKLNGDEVRTESNRPSDAYSAAMKRAEAKIDEAHEVSANA